MKKGFRLIDVVVILFIIIIIGIIAGLLIKSVIKNMKEEKNKILIENYANSVLYTKEFYMKNNENNIPKYCSISKDIIYFDENYNNEYDSNELLCNKECDNDNCIKFFITNRDIENKDVKCNIIKIDNNYLEISNCIIKNKEIVNYKYKLNIENSVE